MDDLRIALYSDDSDKNVQQPRPSPVQGRKQPSALQLSVHQLLSTIFKNLILQICSAQGNNDGQMTMEYHGLPWTTMIFHGHTTMVTVKHGRLCFVKWSPMVDHDLINTMAYHDQG